MATGSPFRITPFGEWQKGQGPSQHSQGKVAHTALHRKKKNWEMRVVEPYLPEKHHFVSKNSHCVLALRRWERLLSNVSKIHSLTFILKPFCMAPAASLSQRRTSVARVVSASTITPVRLKEFAEFQICYHIICKIRNRREML